MKILNRINSQVGESISETLISLLIAALALVMLAGAISSASGVILKSKDKLDKYYSANEKSDGVVKMTGGSSVVSDGITITDTSNSISPQSFQITYYKNDEFSSKPVVAYQYTP